MSVYIQIFFVVVTVKLQLCFLFYFLLRFMKFVLLRQRKQSCTCFDVHAQTHNIHNTHMYFVYTKYCICWDLSIERITTSKLKSLTYLGTLNVVCMCKSKSICSLPSPFSRQTLCDYYQRRIYIFIHIIPHEYLNQQNWIQLSQLKKTRRHFFSLLL